MFVPPCGSPSRFTKPETPEPLAGWSATFTWRELAGAAPTRESTRATAGRNLGSLRMEILLGCGPAKGSGRTDSIILRKDRPSRERDRGHPRGEISSSLG